ncbi:site-specific DNA-methyltransferase [Humibacter antri]
MDVWDAPPGSRLAGNIEAIARLFPHVVAETADEAGERRMRVDFDLLRQELSGGAVENSRERYGLEWPGKRAAALCAATPATTNLREAEDESVDGASTGNVFIAGDNLEALKLLRQTHAGTVKLIYIDPPYNTRNDFVYNDDFGPSHSAWLNMMYPRLILARDLLTDDGVGFVSIDGNEVAQLELLLAEVFGARNVVATIVWVSNLKGRQLPGGGPAGTHEYILCFARNADAVARFRGSASDLHALMPAVYRRPGYAVKHDGKGPYVTKNELYNTNSRFNERTAPTMVFRIHYQPETGEVRVTDIDDDTSFEGFVTAMPHPNHRSGIDWHAWRWSRARVLADRDELEFDASGERLRIRTKVRDVDGMTMKDVVIGPSTMTGQRDLDDLGMHHLFDAPKPVALLRTLMAVTTSDDDLVLDFFAGSGTTAQAVMEQNADDGGHRRFILVQRDERTSPRSEAAAAGFATIADVTAERMRRAGDRLRSRSAGGGQVDTGFRTFRLEPR